MHEMGTGSRGGEWPDDMTVRFEEGDFELLPLLFSRAAWGLDVARHLPATLVVGVDAAERPAVSAGELEAHWEAAWRRRIDHVSDFDGKDIRVEDLDAYRAEFHRIQCQLPPPWRDSFSPDLHERYADWEDDIHVEVRPRIRRPVQPWLVAAWRAGLEHFTILPLVESYAARLTKSRAMVSIGGWSDDDFIIAALDGWARGRD